MSTATNDDVVLVPVAVPSVGVAVVASMHLLLVLLALGFLGKPIHDYQENAQIYQNRIQAHVGLDPTQHLAG